MKNTTLCYVRKDDCYLMLHRVKKQNDLNHDRWIGVGGKFEPGETAEDCLLREVKEETGLTLTRYRLCGVVNFISAVWEAERMYLYLADGFEGTLTDCSEGILEWVKISDVLSLNLWEGDRKFLPLLEQNLPPFEMTLTYDASDRLLSATPNNTPI